MRGDAAIAVTTANLQAWSEERIFASTEGALCEQRTVECGGGIAAVAVSDGETQIRSYPASFRGDVARAGYEHFAGLDLVGHAPRVAEEAVALLTAPRVPGRAHDADPRRPAALAPGPRVGRPRDGARSRARDRGLLRGHELRLARRPRDAPLRLGAHERQRRRDRRGRARHLRLGRRGRGRAPRRDRARGGAQRLPLLARVGGGGRPRALGRVHARRAGSIASRSCG